MKQSRKIYDRAFKEKAVQLSYERHNISELARELGIALSWRVKSTKSLDGSFQVMAS
jgi:transposase